MFTREHLLHLKMLAISKAFCFRHHIKRKDDLTPNLLRDFMNIKRRTKIGI